MKSRYQRLARLGINYEQVLSVRSAQIALAMVCLWSFAQVSAQTAFSTTNLLRDWDENPYPAILASQLATINADINNALNANQNEFCYELIAEPADILQFKTADLNCDFDGSGMNKGFDASSAFDLENGMQDFDYDSRARHSLKITAHATSTTPASRTPNSLTISFNMVNFEEAPVFKSGSPFTTRRFLEVDERVDFSILDIYEDPEGTPLSIDIANIEVCEPATVNTTMPLPCHLSTATGVIVGDYVSTQPRGPRLYITADGLGLTSAGTYYARVRFSAKDANGDVGADSTVEIRIKRGVNNIPSFKGGATGFSIAVDERPGYSTTGLGIFPTPIDAWVAEDLDQDGIGYELVGGAKGCGNISAHAFRIGGMCVISFVSQQNVGLIVYNLNYEDPVLSAAKSFTITLRATDGWDHVDIPITVTINDVNELYIHPSPANPDVSSMEQVLPSDISLIEGESVTHNLADFVTDPENDTLTYTAYAQTYTGLVDVSGSTLTINGTGTNANNPNLTDIITVEVTDGQLTQTRNITVRVRNTNEAPRFEPAGVIAVAGAIDENVPVGTLVSGLVQYADADSTPDEISVIVGSSAFEGIVDPLLENGALCQVPSATCIAQTNRIALVSAAAINFESNSTREVTIGLHDGWVRSDPNQDVTVRITVNNLNDAPLAVSVVPNQAVSVSKVATFDASPYFSDEDAGDRVLVTAASRDPNIASVAVTGAAEVSVTGVGVGSTRIELTGTDLSGASVVQLFDVSVRANLPPVAQTDAFASALPDNLELLDKSIHDIPLAGLFLDPDGDAVQVLVESLDESIVLVAPDRSGTTAILLARGLGKTDLVFTATDSAQNQSTAIYTINVVDALTSPNQAPVLDQSVLSNALPENRQMVVGDFHDLVLTGVFSDPENGVLNVSVSTSNTDVLQVATNETANTVTLLAIGEGSVELTIAATDEGGLSTQTVVSISVISDTPTRENRAPILDSDAFAQALPANNSVQVQRFANVDLSGLFTDPDGDSFTLAATSSDTQILRVTLSTDSESARLIGRSLGSAILTITATDSEGNATEATATIQVISGSNEANEPPTIDRDALTAALPANNTLAVGEFFELQLGSLFSDPDENDQIASLSGSSSNPDVLDVDVDENNILTALALSVGSATLSLVATDSHGASTTVDETITVNAATAASLSIASQTFDRRAPLTLDLDELTQNSNMRDAAHALRVRVGDASIVTASLTDSRLILHGLNQGRTFIKLTDSENSDFAIRSMFYVDVVNAPPTLITPITTQSITRVNGVSLDLSGIFTDADGESFKLFAGTLDDSVIAIKLDGDTLSIQGIEVGRTVLTLTAVDVNGASAEVSFEVHVENVSPTTRFAQVGPIQLQVGGEPYELNYSSWFSDDEGDPLTYTTNMKSSEVIQSSESDGGLTLTPLSRGTVALTVTATDSFGAKASMTTDIVVGDENLKAIASRSLEGFGRNVLSSVSTTFERRVYANRDSSDLAENVTTSNPLSEFESHDSQDHRFVSNTSMFDDGFLSLTRSNVTSDLSEISRTSATSLTSLLGNGISLNVGAQDNPAPWSVWSSMDTQVFGGDSYDGSLSNAYLGIDKEVHDEWLIGVGIARHRSAINYSYGTASQQLDVELHHLTPYARFVPSENTSIWSAFGFGEGKLTTTVVGAEDATSRLTSRLAILGGRQRLHNDGAFELALRGDVASASLATNDSATASGGIAADVRRMRAGLDGTYTIALSDVTSFSPFGQLNIRSDSGASESESGFEFIGGVKFSHQALTIELIGSSFEVDGVQTYYERGLSLATTLNPSRDGSGISASITPTWGADVSSTSGIWSELNSSLSRTNPIRPSNEERIENRMRLTSQIGYGFLLAKDQFLLKPFVQFTSNSADLKRTYVGAQLRQAFRAQRTISSQIGIGQMRSTWHDRATAIEISIDMSL